MKTEEAGFLELDGTAIGIFVKEFAAYGFWGLFAFVFVIWGLPHLAPIFTSIGNTLNERHKANLSHQRRMQKLTNKRDQDMIGKGKRK